MELKIREKAYTSEILVEPCTKKRFDKENALELET
jgi:hypothetical protein